MTTINLREYYPFYHHDEFVEVNDDLADEMQQWERNERAFQRRRYWHHAHFSLNCDDDIEKTTLTKAEMPEERYERKIVYQNLQAALLCLSDKQIRRIYSHYILGLSKAEIARSDKVGKVTVGESITLGLRQLEVLLGDNCR
jgi:hypothetical protein